MGLKQLEGQDGVAVFVDPKEVKAVVQSLAGSGSFVVLNADQWLGAAVKGTPAQVHDALFITTIEGV